MRTLLMFRGAPGCGKSTFIKKHGLEQFALSADNIRLMCQAPIQKADGNYGITVTNDTYVWKLLFEILEQRMKRGEFVVIDATNSLTHDISRYKHLVELYRYRALIVDMTDIPIDVCKARNATRLPEYKRVPEFVIDRMYRRFETEEVPKWIKIIKPEEVDDAIQFKPIDFNKWDKIHHIGDIHGSLDCLKEYLGDIKDNELYIFCGDYCDRGSQNVETLLYMIELSKRDNVLLLTGNHEKHLWDYSKDITSSSKEFAEITAKEFDEAGISKKDIRQFYRRLAQIAYYTYGDKTVLVNHGGIANMPDNLMLMATEQLIRGVGDYDEVKMVEDSFEKSVKGTEIYQIHGHRNIRNNPIRNGHSFNLEGEIEFGGHLRCVTLDKENGFTEIQVKNNNFNMVAYEPDHLDKLSVENVIEALRNNYFIREKKLNNNVSSFNFTEQAFKKRVWNKETIRARGLFINTNINKIVARSYNKFFNIGELPLTKLGNLEENFHYPVVAYEKYNGFLGLLGYNPENDELMYCSKSTDDGEFAELFKTFVQTRYSERGLEDLKRYIKNTNVTFVFEVILKEEDPHIIKYEDSSIVLLDIIDNDINFRHANYETLQMVGAYFAFEVKRKVRTFENWNEFESWYKTEVNSSVNNCLEGFVLEDAEGFMVKIKTDYYNFWKRMRYVASEVYNNGFIKKLSIISEPLAKSFYDWLLTQPKEIQKLNIISLRDKFYEGSNNENIKEVK